MIFNECHDASSLLKTATKPAGISGVQYRYCLLADLYEAEYMRHLTNKFISSGQQIINFYGLWLLLILNAIMQASQYS